MIKGIIGPEGSGKTCYMTQQLCYHAHCGGKVFTFPGYEIHTKRGKALSEVIEPQDWIELPETLTNVVLAIDEADTFFNSLDSQDLSAKLFTNLGKQRRHRNIGIIYTVQDWSWFNNRMRWLTHVLVTCWDLWWTYRMTPAHCPPRGTKIVITPYDVKGFYTGKPWTRGSPKLFNASHYWENYNSFSQVTPYNNMIRYKFQKKVVTIGPDGKAIPEASQLPYLDTESIERFAEAHRPTGQEAIRSAVKQMVDMLRSKHISSIPADAMRSFAASQGISVNYRTLGRYLTESGMRYQQGYRGQNRYEIVT